MIPSGIPLGRLQLSECLLVLEVHQVYVVLFSLVDQRPCCFRGDTDEVQLVTYHQYQSCKGQITRLQQGATLAFYSLVPITGIVTNHFFGCAHSPYKQCFLDFPSLL